MSDLKIEVIARDELGAIVALITPDGVVDVATASIQIALGETCYVTGPDSFVRVPVRAISALGGPYLYANWDGSRRNNLLDLATVRMFRSSSNSVHRTRPSDPASVPRRIRALCNRLFAKRSGDTKASIARRSQR